MDILAAVVDGVRVYQDPFDPPPSEGIAVMTGSSAKRLLPGLWQQEEVAPESSRLTDDKAAIEINLPAFRTQRGRNDGRPLKAKLPLANTVFANGKPNTMFAARLEQGYHGEYPEFTKVMHKTSQVISPGRGPRYHTSVNAPLVAIAEPRKIMTGLGNIMREVEISGDRVPASMELEECIPVLLEARSMSGDDQVEDRPVTVWAAIYPPNYRNPKTPGFKAPGFYQVSRLIPQEAGSRYEELFSKEFQARMPDFMCAGCQIRQVCMQNPPQTKIKLDY